MITLAIIALTSIVSTISFINRLYYDNLMFSVYRIRIKNQYYRLYTHSLIHENHIHLLVNMFILLVVGRYVENYFILNYHKLQAEILYFCLYFFGAIISSLPFLKEDKYRRYYGLTGASGAVSAILFFFIMSTENLYLIAVGIMYLLYCIFKSFDDEHTAHNAHLFGSFFAILFYLLLLLLK